MTTIYQVERMGSRLYVTGPDNIWLDGTRDACRIPVKSVADGEARAVRMERALIDAAEEENARWTMARQYMANRAARFPAQLALF